MSGRWMTAGDRFAEYRSDIPGAKGDGAISNFPTRAVLRELCRIAHDAGIAQVSVAVISDRLGLSYRATQYALARLQRDGWATCAVRGTGNHHGTQPRGSVWILHQLPDADGVLWPHADWLALQWSVYVGSQRWQTLNRANRAAVRTAWTGVDNPESQGLLDASSGSTRRKPLPHSSQVGSQKSESPRGQHPRAAARARGRLALVQAKPTQEP